MPSSLEVESKLTDRYQTTVPETVRRTLSLGKRDKIHCPRKSSWIAKTARQGASDIGYRLNRLFFRDHAPSKLIVLVWWNDEDSSRAYESSDDAYRVLCKMLESGHSPDDWNQLMAEVSTESQQLQRFVAGIVG